CHCLAFQHAKGRLHPCQRQFGAEQAPRCPVVGIIGRDHPPASPSSHLGKCTCGRVRTQGSLPICRAGNELPFRIGKPHLLHAKKTSNKTRSREYFILKKTGMSNWKKPVT